MKYIVWCEEKKIGFETVDYQLAYEVRKGAIDNLGFWIDTDSYASAYSFCELCSCLYDCELIEVK
ncbi:hypothetical protein KNT81_gp089 [Proteus phage phiP4-3]|uniref:Uncharacterized protein n=1 Tax=Proteus phage phiP4-3 TaxID=2065203 RepID=A0A2I6PFG2_9CAUD|nr:hypothetical protein KNT81_gp089 [Proteus phage phiP4-3]AUM58447.1 hypothetical protein phiP43_089 [Proteus phage phiP4-3]AZV01308.1 hypothetical protein vBSdyM006_171 [Shigella phage vB_SdyM_006]